MSWFPEFEFDGFVNGMIVFLVGGVAAAVALVAVVVLWLCGVQPDWWMAWVAGGYAALVTAVIVGLIKLK